MSKIKRRENDLYETPVPIAKQAIDLFNWSKINSFCEPCRASGNIYNNIPRSACKDWFEISRGANYLSPSLKDTCDLIITNPPFSLATEFIEMAESHSNARLFLLRLGFLASRKRFSFWLMRKPNKLFILSKRPSFTDNNATDSQEYAWFYWGPDKFLKKMYHNDYLHILPPE